MRLFFASFLGAENVRFYTRVVHELADRVPGLIRPVPPGTHHLTLAFIGEVDGPGLERCLDALAFEPAPPALPISFAPPKVLYGRGQPRLIFAEVRDGAEALVALQERLCGRLRDHLPDKDLRAKRPHATLARFRKGLRRGPGRRVESALKRLVGDAGARSDTIASVRLVKSTLTPSGPVYETVGECELASAGDPGSGRRS